MGLPGQQMHPQLHRGRLVRLELQHDIPLAFLVRHVHEVLVAAAAVGAIAAFIVLAGHARLVVEFTDRHILARQRSLLRLSEVALQHRASAGGAVQAVVVPPAAGQAENVEQVRLVGGSGDQSQSPSVDGSLRVVPVGIEVAVLHAVAGGAHCP